MEAKTLVVFALLMFLSRIIERTPFFPLWYLLSTFWHELSHYVVGVALGGKPTFPTLFPRKVGGVWVLGQVTLRNPNPFVLLPCGLAPLSLVFFAYLLVLHLPPSLLRDVALFFLLHGSSPSLQDLKTAFSSIPGILFWGAVAVFFFFLLKVSTLSPPSPLL